MHDTTTGRRRHTIALLTVTALLAVAAPVSAHHDLATTETCLDLDPLCAKAVVTVGDGEGPGTCPAGIDTIWNALMHDDAYCI